MLLRPVEMRFSYKESFDVPSPHAYETLLLDVMKNEPTLFMRADRVEAACQILTQVLLKKLSSGTRPGNNANAFRGGYRLWTRRYGGSAHERFIH